MRIIVVALWVFFAIASVCVAQNDREEAEELLRMGREYQNVGRNADAVDCYTKAAWLGHAGAQNGHVTAQNKLGLWYESGHGVEKNRSLAVKWLQKVAARGHQKSIEALQKINQQQE